MSDQAKKTSPNEALIRNLANLLNETGLTEIEVEENNLRVRVARNVTIAAQVPTTTFAMAPNAAATNAMGGAPVSTIENHPGVVTSPMVGTAYRAPEPGTAPFVDVGSTITEGQTILIVEAMKTMNQIPAPRSGVVKRILVENGQPVEYGEPLMIVE